jgi:hypothetical protein
MLQNKKKKVEFQVFSKETLLDQAGEEEDV